MKKNVCVKCEKKYSLKNRQDHSGMFYCVDCLFILNCINSKVGGLGYHQYGMAALKSIWIKPRMIDVIRMLRRHPGYFLGVDKIFISKVFYNPYEIINFEWLLKIKVKRILRIMTGK